MILCVTDDLIISLCLHVLYPYYLFICHSMSVCSQIVIPIAGPGYVIQNSILEHCCQLICCISIQSRCIIMEVLDVLYISLHSPCITIEVLDLQISLQPRLMSN
ncbi:hypothetical protein BDA96_01G245100 [Sorghum bicolor]|uniref:Uncharacterized protein n=1 Tax=Sorghum bicolor TaxID=4558 RepID=A0A921S0S8_SORBI|nr:hypothetical protein BDA96_01G245100 [Sorghum bicolor]